LKFLLFKAFAIGPQGERRMKHSTTLACLLLALAGACTAGEFQPVSTPIAPSSAAPKNGIPLTQPASRTPAHANTQLGSAELPIMVRTLDSAETVTDRAEAKADRAIELANGHLMLYLAALMALIALAQLIFFAWQLRLMRKSVDDASVAARAAASAAGSADLNARAAIGIELPVLRVIPPNLLLTDELLDHDGPYFGQVNDGVPTRHSAVGNLEVRNDGRTPAVPVSISVGWTVTAKLPQSPTYRRTDFFGHASLVRPGETFTCQQAYGIELTDEEIKSIDTDKAWLWFFGMIEYRDFLEDSRLVRFCWRFANRNFDTVCFFFESDGNPPAQYTRNGMVVVSDEQR
jgi:hypothetical protein